MNRRFLLSFSIFDTILGLYLSSFTLHTYPPSQTRFGIDDFFLSH